jgi:hypothetical protein
MHATHDKVCPNIHTCGRCRGRRARRRAGPRFHRA